MIYPWIHMNCALFVSLDLTHTEYHYGAIAALLRLCWSGPLEGLNTSHCCRPQGAFFQAQKLGRWVLAGNDLGTTRFWGKGNPIFGLGRASVFSSPKNLLGEQSIIFQTAWCPKLTPKIKGWEDGFVSWIGICYVVPWRVWYTPAFFGHRPSFCQLKTRLAFESWEYIKPRATLIAENPATWRKPDLEWHDERCGIVMSNTWISTCFWPWMLTCIYPESDTEIRKSD